MKCKRCGFYVEENQICENCGHANTVSSQSQNQTQQNVHGSEFNEQNLYRNNQAIRQEQREGNILYICLMFLITFLCVPVGVVITIVVALLKWNENRQSAKYALIGCAAAATIAIFIVIISYVIGLV